MSECRTVNDLINVIIYGYCIFHKFQFLLLSIGSTFKDQ